MKKKLLFLFATLLTSIGTWAQSEDMLSTPLTFEAFEEGTLSFKNRSAGPVTYRVNGGETQTVESMKEVEIPLAIDDKVEFFGDNATYYDEENDKHSHFKMSSHCYIYGNIMSLISSSNFATAKTLTGKRCFIEMFRNSHVKNHPSRQLMLPATTLADSCYVLMFYDCTGLTEAPKLPATTLAEGCYHSMFQYCEGLAKAPELPATRLANNCYRGMFTGCTGLTEAPKLPATTMAEKCYFDMFYDCKGLTEAPELPATTLAERCYDSMFAGCTGLTKAPELPATELAGGCYWSMFYGCTGLTEAPDLPAITLAEYCYRGMFYGCTGLTKAPELPATTLVKYCYDRMFTLCTGLTEAPKLPATTLEMCCYREMFKGCTGLNSVTCLATNIITTVTNESIYGWLEGVSTTGTFYKHPDMKEWPTGVNGIPEGWTVVDYDMTGINATTAAAKANGTTYDLRGMKSTGEKKGLKVVSGKKIITK